MVSLDDITPESMGFFLMVVVIVLAGTALALSDPMTSEECSRVLSLVTSFAVMNVIMGAK